MQKPDRKFNKTPIQIQKSNKLTTQKDNLHYGIFRSCKPQTKKIKMELKKSNLPSLPKTQFIVIVPRQIKKNLTGLIQHINIKGRQISISKQKTTMIWGHKD